MNWLQAAIFFALGTFLGPWLLSKIAGRKSGAPAGY